MKKRKFLPLRISVLVVSDTRTDTTAPSRKILDDRLTKAGQFLAEKCIRLEQKKYFHILEA